MSSKEALSRLLHETAGGGAARRVLDIALAAVEETAGGPSMAAMVEPGRVLAVTSAGLAAPSDDDLAQAAARTARGEDPFDDGEAADGLLAAAGLPVGDGRVALIGTAGRPGGGFEETAPVILVAMARLALLARDRRRAAEVERLNETAQRVAAFLDVDQVLHEIVGDAVELIGADSGDIVLLDPLRQAMRVVAVANLPEDMVGFELEPDEGVSHRAMAARRTIIVADYQQYRHRVRRLDSYGFRAIVSAPLVASGEAIGVLNVHTVHEGHRFSREDAHLLQTFANHAAIAIANARRYENEARLARDLGRANDELARSLTLQQRLAEQVLLDRGPAGVVEVLAGLLERPVVVQDELFRVVAGAAPPGSDGWEPLALPRDAASMPEVAAFLRQVSASGRAALAPVPPLQGPPRLVAPLPAGPDVSGYLILPSGQRLQPLDRALIEVASTGVALEMANLRARVEVENQLRGDVMSDLLGGSFSTPDAIDSRAARLGYDLAGPRDLLAFAPELPEEAEDLPGLRRRLVGAIEAALSEHSPGSIVAAQGELIVALSPRSDEPRRLSAGPLVEAVRMRVAKDLPDVTFTASIGEPCDAAEDYAPSFVMARRALEAVRRLGYRDRVVDARQLGVARLLVGATAPQDLAAFARTMLEPLLQPGESARNLLSTLRAYIESGFNQRETARRCYIHINTVAYRLRRIESLLGVNLDGAETLMDVTFALRVADLLGLGGE